MIRRKLISIAVFSAFFHAPAHAADVVMSADQAAMGGTSVAASRSNAAMSANPSLLGLHERYDLHAHGRLGYDGRTEWAVSAVDARTSKYVSLGLLYRGDISEPELTTPDLPGWTEPGETPSNIKRHHDLIAAFAVPLPGRRVSIGLSGTYSFYNHDRQGKGGTGNLDAGLGWHTTQWLVLGLAGRNLLPIDGVGELPLTGAFGARASGTAGALELDFEYSDEVADLPIVAATGFELAAGEITRLRAGYRYEGVTTTHRVTAGVGFEGGAGSISLGTMVPVSPAPQRFGDVAWVLAVHLKAPTADEPPF